MIAVTALFAEKRNLLFSIGTILTLLGPLKCLGTAQKYRAIFCVNAMVF